MDRYLILTADGPVDGDRLGDADTEVLGAYGFAPGMETLQTLDLPPGQGACVVRVRVVETIASLAPELVEMT